MKTLMRYKALILLLFLFFLPFLAGFMGLKLHDSIQWVRSQGAWAFFLTIPAHVLLSVSPISSDPIALTNGFLYGIVLGAVANWIGSMLGSVTGYWLVYFSAQEINLERAMGRLPRFLRELPVSSPLFLIGIRFVPLVGSDFIKVAAPVYRVPFSRYLWTSAVAIFPWAIATASIGSGVFFLMEHFF